MQRNSIDPMQFAQSARELLSEDPRRYRNFGAYWFFVKALLRRIYDRHEMPILGDYVDESVVDRMPTGLSAHELIEAAIEEYRVNATLNVGRNQIEDEDGEYFTLLDTDVEG